MLLFLSLLGAMTLWENIKFRPDLYRFVWTNSAGWAVAWGTEARTWSELLHLAGLRTPPLPPDAERGFLMGPDAKIAAFFAVLPDGERIIANLGTTPVSAIIDDFITNASGLLDAGGSSSLRSLQLSPSLFLQARPGDRVRSHLNLGPKLKSYGMRTFSVKPMNASTTIGHVTGLELANVDLVVKPGGARRVQQTGHKTVHAWLAGDIVASTPPGAHIEPAAVPVRYNPHQGMMSFMRQAPDGSWSVPVHRARRATLIADESGWRVNIDP